MLTKSKKEKKEIFKEAKEVRDSLTESNMFTGLPVSIAFLFIEVITYLCLFFVNNESLKTISPVTLIPSIFFTVITVAFVIITISFKHIKKYNKTCAHIFVILFVMASYVFGIFWTVSRYEMNGSFYLLIATTVFLPMLFYINPFYLVAFTVLSYLVMAIGFLVYHPESPKPDFVQQFTLITMMGFFILAYIIRYKDKKHSVKADLRLKKVNEELNHISMRDALTGLKNRHALREDFDTYIRQNIVVMMSDVDDFKFYNDSFGHEIGDKILKGLADSFSITFDNEHCYRYGGDEFLIIIPGLRETEVKMRIAEWRANNKPLAYNDSEVKCSSSCGYVYGTPESTADLNRMLKFADKQLYEAKHRGKNCEIGCSYLDALYHEKDKSRFTKIEGSKDDVDALTGARTMSNFVNKAWLSIHNLMDMKREIGIVYFDIQGFKTFNERYGYTEGDKLLKSFAQTLSLSFENDLIARFSDDHFVVLTYLTGIERKVEGISEILFSNWGKRVNAGIYKYNEKDNDISLICDHARLACQSIKDVPDAVFRFYDEELTKAHEKKLHIINKFDEALKKNQIKVVYQPIVDVKTNAITHFEALTRWVDPVYGTLRPDEFIPVLEEIHRIHEMDLYILQVIAKDLHSNKDKSGFSLLPVTINISWMDFILTPMLERVERILRDYNLTKNMICFEIKESTFSERTDAIKSKIDLLRSAGYEVWLDNFGSGYFPLSKFDEYNFDVIKIDMNYMKKFYADKRIYTMLASFISNADELGVTFLAQGVETQEQLEVLKKVGCGKAQGYLFGQPRPFDQLKDTYFF